MWDRPTCTAGIMCYGLLAPAAITPHRELVSAMRNRHTNEKLWQVIFVWVSTVPVVCEVSVLEMRGSAERRKEHGGQKRPVETKTGSSWQQCTAYILSMFWLNYSLINAKSWSDFMQLIFAFKWKTLKLTLNTCKPSNKWDCKSLSFLKMRDAEKWACLVCVCVCMGGGRIFVFVTL